MIQKPKRLAYLLDIDTNQLESLLKETDKFYYVKREPKTNQDGSIRYKNGEIEYRIMHPSTGILKQVQKKIKTKILSHIGLPCFLHGGVEKRDNITNAKVHQGNKYHFRTDLRNFYPSINNRLVYEMLINNSFSPDVSRILTILTTYNGQVPQGAPTSTHIANLVFLPVDIEINEYCQNKRINYTRFIDDLSFSAQYDFNTITKDIIKIINDNNYALSHNKTFFKVGPTLTTGVISKNNTLIARQDQFEKLSGKQFKNNQKLSLSNYIERVNNYK